MRCGTCGAAVHLTITEAGRRLLVDARPDPEGNTAVYRDGTGTWRSRRPTAELPVAGWERLHKPHVATCGGGRAAGAPSTACPARPLPEGVVDLAARRSRRGSGR